MAYKSKKRVSSNSAKAKKIIRDEMLSYFPAREYGTRTRLAAMKKDADAGHGGMHPSRRVSDYNKAAYLVDAAALAIYDQDRMLGKIYGKKNVKGWTNDKKHSTYRHLVAREYDAMQRSTKNPKAKKKNKR